MDATKCEYIYDTPISIQEKIILNVTLLILIPHLASTILSCLLYGLLSKTNI